MDVMMGHLGQGIWLILLLSLPAVLLAAGIGLVIGILQAVTQVQEQTISAAPKILFVFLLVIFGGPFMVEMLKDYLRESAHLSFEVLPKDELMILPPKPRLAYGEDNSRLDFFKEKKKPPSSSQIRQMMQKPSAMQGFTETAGGMKNNSTRPKPKPGLGEQVYMKRRAAGNLPKPPNRKE